MDNNLLEKLKALDTEVLTGVVRQDQRNPSFAITDWSVKCLSDKGIANPEGLWLFSGRGNDGKNTKSWSVVLKILLRDEQNSSPSELWYWKREFLFAQSELTSSLPTQVKAPRYYHCEELPESAWI